MQVLAVASVEWWPRATRCLWRGKTKHFTLKVAAFCLLNGPYCVTHGNVAQYQSHRSRSIFKTKTFHSGSIMWHFFSRQIKVLIKCSSPFLHYQTAWEKVLRFISSTLFVTFVNEFLITSSVTNTWSKLHFFSCHISLPFPLQ